MSGLVEAAENGQLGRVLELLRAGADVNEKEWVRVLVT